MTRITEGTQEMVGLREERDTAQSLVEAWASVVEGLEAHIMDRAENGDPAKPQTYLRILRGDVANVQRASEQIRAARWADYKRQSATIERQASQLAGVVGERDALNAKRVDAICDEAVKLAKHADAGGRETWRAAYHAVMLTREALSAPSDDPQSVNQSGVTHK